MKAVKDIKEVAQVRHTDVHTGRFCIVDGRELVFMVMNDQDVHPTYDVGIWVNTPFFANALRQLFDLAWNEMEEVGDKAPMTKEETQEMEEELKEAGMDDEETQ
jgi:hypothetical protein